MLTFTASNEKSKNMRTGSGGGKSFNTTTPNLPRKMMYHSTHKNKYEGELLIVGHQAS